MDATWLNEIAKGRALSNQNRRFEDPEPTAPLAKARAFAKVEPQQPMEPETTTIKIKPNTIAHRMNNPGNLRFAGQRNATKGEQGFAKFDSPLSGWEGLLKQVELEQGRNHTLESLITKYAPPTENDTQKYIKYMEKKLNVSKKTPVRNIPTHKVAEAIAFFESNTTINK